MNVYRVQGTFRMGRIRHQPFTLEVAAESEARAREVVLSDLGSKHGARRRAIAIATVTELRPDEVTDPIARVKAGIGE